MGLTIDVTVPASTDETPIFEICGDDDLSFGLLNEVRFDIEMPADEEGNPFLRLRLPDRKMLLVDSAPMPGELFFLLEERLAGRPNRPVVLAVEEGREQRDITGSLGWALLDFSGAWVRALKAAASRDLDRAVDCMKEAVTANPADEGFRVVLGRFLVAAGRAEEAGQAFRDELERFPGSYRAQAELAALDCRAGKAESAYERLMKGLSVYPNHLRSLLLLSDLLLAGGGDEAVPFLARAFRLAGSLAPQHIHAVLERRKRTDLLPAIRLAARKTDLAAPIAKPGKGVSGVSGDVAGEAAESSSKVEPAVQEAPGQEEAPGADLKPVTKETVIRLAAREIYKDGKVTPEEKLMFKKICEAFPLGADRTRAIVKEERDAAAARGVREGDFVPVDFFRRLLELVYEDEKVSKGEVSLVMNLARTLGLSRSECTGIQTEVRKAMKDKKRD